MKQYLKHRLAQVSVAAGSLVPALAVATEPAGPDYAPITAALVVGGLVAAIVGAAAIKAGPNLAKWGANKIANFFR